MNGGIQSREESAEENRQEIRDLRRWISRAKSSFSLRDCRKCKSPVFPGHTCGYCGDDDSVPDGD